MDGYPVSPLETGRRARATIDRADRAVLELGTGKPFLLVYYGSDKAGGWQRIDAPLRTVTTIDRFALVKWEHGKRAMRMLQVPELERAMGFDSQLEGRNFQLRRGSRRDRVRLLGNAVCPPVMEQIVRHLATAGA
jgi:DNA (cytosine-5)-methyltransferase 1